MEKKASKPTVPKKNPTAKPSTAAQPVVKAATKPAPGDPVERRPDSTAERPSTTTRPATDSAASTFARPTTDLAAEAIMEEFLQKFDSKEEAMEFLNRVSAAREHRNPAQTPTLTTGSSQHTTEAPVQHQPHADTDPGRVEEGKETAEEEGGKDASGLVGEMQRMEVGDQEARAAGDDGDNGDLDGETPVGEVFEGETPVSENVEGETPVFEGVAEETPMSVNVEGETPVTGDAEGETPVVGISGGETPCVGLSEGETPIGDEDGETPIEEDVEGETPGENIEGETPAVEMEEVIPREQGEKVAEGDEEREDLEKEIVDLGGESAEEETPVDDRTTRKATRLSKMLEELEKTPRSR